MIINTKMTESPAAPNHQQMTAEPNDYRSSIIAPRSDLDKDLDINTVLSFTLRRQGSIWDELQIQKLAE